MTKSRSPSVRQVAWLAAASLVAGQCPHCVAQDGQSAEMTDRALPLRASHWRGEPTQEPGLIEDVAVVRRLPPLPRQNLAPSPLPRPIAISAAPQLHLASAPLRISSHTSELPMESAEQSSASKPSNSETPPSTPNKSKPDSNETKTPPINFLPAQLPISSISIDVRAKSEKGNDTRPQNQSIDALGQIPVVASAPAMAWSGNVPASAYPTVAEVPYQPLYFEEANLERYGRSAGTLQPAVSAGRFFGTIPLLPYAMTNHPPGQAYHWRWPYPAGWLAPRVREHEPINPKAALVQAGSTTGLIFVLP